MFEESARVPLIITAPEIKSTGQHTSAISEMIDIYPTLADLCGLPAPEDVDGVSLKPQLEDPSAPGKEFAITQAVRYKNRWISKDRRMDRDVHGYSIRTDNFRFSSWDNGGEEEELYDLNKDPEEFHNVVNDPNYQYHAEALRSLFNKQIGSD